MDELIEKLAIAFHDDTKCPHPFSSHTDRSKDEWRSQARIAIEFIRQHKSEFLTLAH